ncbi:MAG: prolipoprotein diacylglyceryl transferase [Patescibacteria group bacterium]
MVNPYGILISFSILLCILVVKSLLRNHVKENKNFVAVRNDKSTEDILWGLSLWAIIGGIAGARIYHILSMFPYYVQNPLKILAVWDGGLGIWGAIVGGIISTVIYLKRNKENILYWLDLISVVLPLGQAIGRWGNYFNGEIFGTPTNLPWGLYVPVYNRPEEYLSFTKFHPLFLYESILDIIFFFFLYFLYKKHKDSTPSGIFLSLYLGGYSIIRFFLEYLRIYSWKLGSLNVSQCISILVLSFSIVFTKYLSTKMKRRKI